MEEKKLDPYQLIGFVLIALIMTWMLMRQQEQNLNNQAKVKSESESLNKSENKLPSQNSKLTNKESLGLENLNYSSEKVEEFYQISAFLNLRPDHFSEPLTELTISQGFQSTPAYIHLHR